MDLLDALASTWPGWLAVWGLVVPLVAWLMERWSALVHERIWHGPLWFIHRTHHEPQPGPLERNDLLSGTHAPVAIALIAWGWHGPPGLLREVALGAGIGMTLFGVAYALVHDGYVHERYGRRLLPRWGWLQRVRTAHRVHHADGAAPYGLFFGPAELERRRAALRRQRPT